MPPRSRDTRAPRKRIRQAPHLCRACGLPFVQADGLAAEDSAWRVVLRCPSCGWESEEVLDDVALERLDEELDRGMEQLMGALARLTESNMREYLDLFSAALASDAILPIDF